MTFKPTHRITTDLIGFDKGELVQRIGSGDSGREYGDKYISEDGRRADVQDDFVEPIEHESPVTGFIPSKSYRLTLVATADADGTIDGDFGIIRAEDIEEDPNANAELLPDPLPTAPESVIRWVDRGNKPHSPVTRSLLRAVDGTWIDRYGIRWPDDQIDPADATALFDAGAE